MAKKKTKRVTKKKAASKTAPNLSKRERAPEQPRRFFPGPWPLVILRRSDGTRLAVVVFETETEGWCLLWGTGGWHDKPPKGWRVRRDRDRATGSGDVHYHCVSDENDKYVVTADGKGSHDTTSGTQLPRRLGDFLHDELEVPLNTNAEGKWVVSFLPFGPFGPPSYLVGLLEDALNAEVREEP